ncbi:MAG: hypothetical protein JWO24_3877 [Rhodospirillales bacterium]|nr:hypothetical protein [Rhodospirillales bacterium]
MEMVAAHAPGWKPVAWAILLAASAIVAPVVAWPQQRAFSGALLRPE